MKPIILGVLADTHIPDRARLLHPDVDKVFRQAGVEARLLQLLYAHEVDFWDDKFYVWLTIGDATEPALDIAKLFALNVSAAIHE